MKVFKLIWAVMICSTLSIAQCFGQEASKLNQHLPILISIQFHSLAVPFHHLKSNFRNVGVSIGTEVDYGKSSDMHQQISLVWYHNKAVGNGLMLHSQAVWRPYIEDAFGELKAGIGYNLSRRPVESFQFKNGEWTSVGKRGKGLLVIPVGLGAGFTQEGQNYTETYFMNYQIMAVNGYNRTIPILTETLIQFGTSLKKN